MFISVYTVPSISDNAISSLSLSLPILSASLLISFMQISQACPKPTIPGTFNVPLLIPFHVRHHPSELPVLLCGFFFGHIKHQHLLVRKF